MLHPQSICIIGATQRLQYGGRFLQNLIETKYKGRIYPVNPRYEEIMGIRCYPDVASLPEAPDLAGIVIPYENIKEVLVECGKKGVKTGVIITGQFAEIGTPDRKKTQEWLKEFTLSSGMRLCGPNCLGIANVTDNIWSCATGINAIKNTVAGDIALVSQSGASAFGPFQYRAQDRGLGLSYIISTGNEADLSATDFILYCLRQPNVKGIVAYFEGIKDGDKFRRVAEEALKLEKPIVALKVGRSASGQKAAMSHTASMTGSDEVIDAIFKQFGITRVEDWDELLETGACLTKAHPFKKKTVGIVSSSGGVATQFSDKCEQVVGIPQPSPATKESLSKILRGFGSASNPADVTGRAGTEELDTILDLMLKDEAFGGLVLGLGGPDEQAKRIIRAADNTDKPVMMVWIRSEREIDGLRLLQSSRVAMFYHIENLAKAMRALINYHERLDRFRSGETAERITKRVHVADIVNQSGNLELSKSFELLTRFGIPSAKSAITRSLSEAERIAKSFSFPVVVKAQMPHKTDKGLVRVNLNSKSAVRNAYREIKEKVKATPGTANNGILVQEMVKGGIEVIIGIKNDPVFGPAILLGMGGILAELIKDVSLRVCPITLSDIRDMMSEIKGFRLLKGFRGQGPYDIPALEDTLLKVSNLAYQLKDKLAELDINPLIVLPEGQGVRAVDALVILK